MNEYLANLNAKLDAYEDILGKQPYLAGEVSFSHPSDLIIQGRLSVELDLGRLVPSPIRSHCDR